MTKDVFSFIDLFILFFEKLNAACMYQKDIFLNFENTVLGKVEIPS